MKYVKAKEIYVFNTVLLKTEYIENIVIFTSIVKVTLSLI